MTRRYAFNESCDLIRSRGKLRLKVMSLLVHESVNVVGRHGIAGGAVCKAGIGKDVLLVVMLLDGIAEVHFELRPCYRSWGDVFFVVLPYSTVKGKMGQALHVAKTHTDGLCVFDWFLGIFRRVDDGILTVKILINCVGGVIWLVKGQEHFVDVLWAHLVVLQLKIVEEFAGVTVSKIAVVIAKLREEGTRDSISDVLDKRVF